MLERIYVIGATIIIEKCSGEKRSSTLKSCNIVWQDFLALANWSYDPKDQSGPIWFI